MKYSAFICSLFIFLFIGVQSIFAQDYTMKGKVSDSNGPLVGASVVVKDNPAIGTMTGSAGERLLAEIPLVAPEDVPSRTFPELCAEFLKSICLSA